MGIVVFNENGVQITENSVGGLDTNESADAIGIGVGTQAMDATLTTSGGVTNAFVSRNRVNGVNSSSTTGFSAAGIAVAGAAGGANTIVNNMITGVTSPATSPDIVAGIYVVGVAGSTTQLYYNSVSMTGDRGAVATQMPSFGIAVTGTDPTLVAKNNIFYTTQTASGGGVDAKSYAIGMVTTTFANLDSNYNAFYSTGANDGGFRSGSLTTAAGTDYATLAAWQAAVADDANSVEIDPQFSAPTTDLHLTAASPVRGLGTPLASVTTDYDGQLRNPSAPDMGADEYYVLATCPMIGNYTEDTYFSSNPCTATGYHHQRRSANGGRPHRQRRCHRHAGRARSAGELRTHQQWSDPPNQNGGRQQRGALPEHWQLRRHDHRR